MGLNAAEVVDLAEASFRYAFLRDDQKRKMITDFRAEAERLGLL